MVLRYMLATHALRRWPPAQDAVPRSGKFIHLFKRGGNRVIINTLGDLIVRPSPLEASLRQTPAGGHLQSQTWHSKR